MTKYPDSFADKIMTVTVGSGCKNLVNQIYNRVQYVKKLKSGKSAEVTENENADHNKTTSGKRKLKASVDVDQNGCVEHAPMLPEGETNESQLEKKHFLKNEAVAVSRDEKKIEQFLEMTYPT